LGNGRLPVVAARLKVAETCVHIELRTDVQGTGEALPAVTPSLHAALTLSDYSFLALLRREVWEKAQEHGGAFLDPVDLELGAGRFGGRVRLWNPMWPVWWQDFHVSGPLRLEDGEVKVAVTEVEALSGRGGLWSARVLADPVRDTLANTLSGRFGASLPGELGKQVRGVHLGARIVALHDAAGAFVVEAEMRTTVGSAEDGVPATAGGGAP
jgi:hypothetical protein